MSPPCVFGASFFFFSSRRRHTRCALVTGVQTCALPIYLPERDRYSQNMKQMKARLALCFGGRIAEQLIYGKDELNTGASNDIQQATDMARSMVMEYGMSDKLGWLRYRDNQDEEIGRAHV